ncbi:hypothetical protein BZA05DRAFT_438864 [Tricharina praecox]|uniref:uncharacterized protein n=1 Tax=Tricharina praecox TaxID=43433 RepID=UPI002220AEFF|nr:uncharacterized protein BZA05DRAFT_438864 [Tricharina praecox]KAI5844220.1 hypothetical protein BZA05DRAFT_438864 [Tricharina praecox]
MSLTFQNLHELEWEHRRRGEATPDPVTAFVIQQQALHEKGDAWRPHISDNSGEMRGTNHIVQPYEGRRQKRRHRAREEIVMQETNVSSRERKAEAHRLVASPRQRKRGRECSSSGGSLDYAERHADRENSLMVDVRGGEEVVWDGRKTRDFQKRARHKMLDKSRKTASRAIPSKPSPPPKKKNGMGMGVGMRMGRGREKGKGKEMGKGDTLLKKTTQAGVTSGHRTLPATHGLEVIRNGRTHVPLSRGLPDLTFSDMSFLGQMKPRLPAVEERQAPRSYRATGRETSHGTSFVPSGGFRGHTRSISVASAPAHRRESLSRGSTTIASGLLMRESLDDHNTSPSLRESITTDSDAHSEYSLQLRRARKYGGGPPDDDPARITPLPQPAAIMITTPQRPQKDDSPRPTESGPAGETNPKEGEKPVCTVHIAAIEEEALPALHQTPSSPLHDLIRLCAEFTPTKVSEKGPINTGPTDHYSCEDGQSSGFIAEPNVHTNHSHQPEYHSAAGFVGNASTLHAGTYHTDPLGYTENDIFNHRSHCYVHDRESEYMYPQRMEASIWGPSTDPHTRHHGSDFTYDHSVFPQFNENHDRHDHHDSNHYTDHYSPRNDHIRVNHYGRDVTPGETTWNVEDNYLRDSQHLSQYDQEDSHIVAPSRSGSYIPGSPWNRQRPGDSPSLDISHHPDRQLGNYFESDSHLSEGIPGTNVESQFDLRPEEDFPELNIEDPFDRHLREGFGISLDLDGDYPLEPSVGRQRYDSPRPNTGSHFDPYPYLEEESWRSGPSYQNDPLLNEFWKA